MCNFSQGFYERGFKEGFREGYRQSQIASLKAVMKKLKLSFAEACDLLDIPDIEREKYHACIKNDNKPDDIDG